jgi:hypothetical protein
VRRGLVRVEVSVRREDAALLRSVASALADPTRHKETRQILRQRFDKPAATSLKALLAAAPLEDVELDRDQDIGRDVEL